MEHETTTTPQTTTPDEKHTEKKARRKRRKHRVLKTLIIIVVTLCAIRIILPYVILYYANKKLAHLDGNYGHIRDIDLALYRGAYVIKDIYIKKVNGKDTTEFFSCPRIDLSVQWHEIFQGKIVGEVEFSKPVIKYTLNKTLGKNAPKDSTNFIQLVRDFMPLRINRFAVFEGQIHYLDPGTRYSVDVPMTNVHIEATNLTNKPDTAQLMPATINMTGALYGGGITVNVKLDPLSDIPTFDLNGQLNNTNLVNMNQFFKAYGDFDVERGNFGLYTEIAARDSAFKGYVKPIIKDIKIVKFSKEEGSFPQIVWEAFLGGTVEVFSNQKKDQFATNVPFEGKFKHPKIDIVEAIFAVLRNAFIEALRPSIDNSINIDSVNPSGEGKKKGIWARVFGKDDKDKSKDKDKDKKK